MTRGTLLFELGTEELPATAQGAMSESLHNHLIAALNSCGLDFEDSRFFATPRRLAVQIDGLLLEAPDVEREVLGPPIAASRDADGNWTPAAEGFARKQGVPLDLLEAVATPKGERLGLKVTEAGVLAREVVPNLVAEAVAAIPVAKYMRWGRKRCEFLRPVQWLVLLLDDTVLPLSLFELEADRTSRGHRFHHPNNVAINHAKDYEKLLFQAKVIADFDTRRNVVANQVETVAEVGTPVIAEDLLDEVTGLVEWPIALAGTFDEAFLQVPQEALISSMKTHQKYFHLVDDSGALLPRFITVANIESKDPAKVIAGNEKVIRPRLSDAAFLFDRDKKTPLVH
ncbi:glycyl-tRNA synthetase beta subunit [Luminiphilus syltensis NOR5-1B]|uniref:Glycine--tRNA ligase beta subunit n=1 Tax=Luminiphilus syltensis NOR5-1B TaxID=565045 RepID=B8KUF3_9GAMM|nr:glycyl-tRNA synthetase beta subunit [Luminiphilus syltensis NOR5-1B]